MQIFSNRKCKCMKMHKYFEDHICVIINYTLFHAFIGVYFSVYSFIY